MKTESAVNIVRAILILLAGFVGCVTHAAEKTYGQVVVDEVTSIYDADTFTVTIRSWPPVIGERIKVRVKGIDAPELKAKCVDELRLARAAKQKTVEMLRAAKTIELRELGRDKYFRLLADVYVDGKNLADALIKQGFARRYDGGKKSPWCASKESAG